MLNTCSWNQSCVVHSWWRTAKIKQHTGREKGLSYKGYKPRQRAGKSVAKGWTTVKLLQNWACTKSDMWFAWKPVWLDTLNTETWGYTSWQSGMQEDTAGDRAKRNTARDHKCVVRSMWGSYIKIGGNPTKPVCSVGWYFSRNCRKYSRSEMQRSAAGLKLGVTGRWWQQRTKSVHGYRAKVYLLRWTASFLVRPLPAARPLVTGCSKAALVFKASKVGIERLATLQLVLVFKIS